MGSGEAEIQTFDGKVHQRLMVAQSVLSSARDLNRVLIGNVDTLPLVQPYRFLLREREDRTLTALRDRRRWKPFIETARIVRQEMMDGYQCVLVEFPWSKSVNQIWFASSLDYFPVRYEHSPKMVGIPVLRTVQGDSRCLTRRWPGCDPFG